MSMFAIKNKSKYSQWRAVIGFSSLWLVFIWWIYKNTFEQWKKYATIFYNESIMFVSFSITSFLVNLFAGILLKYASILAKAFSLFQNTLIENMCFRTMITWPPSVALNVGLSSRPVVLSGDWTSGQSYICFNRFLIKSSIFLILTISWFFGRLLCCEFSATRSGRTWKL